MKRALLLLLSQDEQLDDDEEVMEEGSVVSTVGAKLRVHCSDASPSGAGSTSLYKLDSCAHVVSSSNYMFHV